MSAFTIDGIMKKLDQWRAHASYIKPSSASTPVPESGIACLGTDNLHKNHTLFDPSLNELGLLWRGQLSQDAVFTSGHLANRPTFGTLYREGLLINRQVLLFVMVVLLMIPAVTSIFTWYSRRHCLQVANIEILDFISEVRSRKVFLLKRMSSAASMLNGQVDSIMKQIAMENERICAEIPTFIDAEVRELRDALETQFQNESDHYILEVKTFQILELLKLSASISDLSFNAGDSGAQINEQVQTSDDQRRASAHSEPISPRTSKPASISGPKLSPVAGWDDVAAKHDKADTAQSRAEHNQEVEKGHESAALGTQLEDTLAQPKSSEGTQSPQTPGSAKGNLSGKHTPEALRLKPETCTSARYEKNQGPGPASAQSPSKPNTEPTSAELGKSRWAPLTPTQAQPKTPTRAGVEGGRFATPTVNQPPSKPNTESASAGMSKSMWATSTPTQAQTKAPTRAGIEGNQSASPASGQAPKLAAPASAEMSKSRWADESPTAQRSKSVSLPSAKNPKGDLGETF
ncbi:uncharacterized protein Aud_000389 [Aspergillus udagawae]|uniref:Uncharacterized protein n=1 Tax=Aspergillus udagawae TaxID=91492 RepID=A0A8E0QKH8_9EURO|nr:uncharacterized protein Aud_000389 [Aspergillus udagawae]GIC84571.1 hypothetical protein Aud_000389 [Aspergillus udagawae]